MKKIFCKECGKELNKKASVCPNCGVKVHPTKDTLKIVAIVFGVIIVLVLGAFILSGGLTSAIKEFSTTIKYKKAFGSYELVGNIEDYNNYNGILYDSHGTKLDNSFNTNDIYTSLELKIATTDKYSYLESGLLDNEIIYNTSQNYIILEIGTYDRYNEKIKTYACFKYSKNYLNQTDCIGSSTNDLGYIENLGLKYKKIK